MATRKGSIVGFVVTRVRVHVHGRHVRGHGIRTAGGFLATTATATTSASAATATARGPALPALGAGAGVLGLEGLAGLDDGLAGLALFSVGVLDDGALELAGEADGEGGEVRVLVGGAKVHAGLVVLVEEGHAVGELLHALLGFGPEGGHLGEEGVSRVGVLLGLLELGLEVDEAGAELGEVSVDGDQEVGGAAVDALHDGGELEELGPEGGAVLGEVVEEGVLGLDGGFTIADLQETGDGE